MNSNILGIVRQFAIPEGEISAKPYGNGHINDTYCVTFASAQGNTRLIIQRVNRYVFKQPEDVIANIEKVTDYLRGVIEREGGDPSVRR